MDYYCNKHVPMVEALLGDDLYEDWMEEATVEKGIGGGAPGSPAPYAGMGIMYFNSIEEFGNLISPIVNL